MNPKDISRRAFIKTSAIGSAAVLSGCQSSNGFTYKAKGLPTTTLGKTGVTIPRMAIGCGSRFLAMTPDDGIEMMEFALDNGLYYWDTAHNYVNKPTGEFSEERLGKVLKTRRKEVFLATKLPARQPDDVKRQLEISLQRLQTDRVDLLNIHSINSLDDAKSLGAVVETLERIREQGMTRFIGFTGHSTSEGMAYCAENYKLDFMLCALNHYQKGTQAFEKNAVPTAAKNGLGVMVMKVIRPRETVSSLQPEQLIRYALSLPHANGAVLSMQSLELMKKNIALLKTFEPMTEAEMDQMAMALQPFYRSRSLDWLQSGYQDGVLV